MKEFDGRRIKEVDGGWLILNGEKYAALLSNEERRIYNSAKQREYRARDAVAEHGHPDKERESKAIGTLQEVREFCKQIGLPETIADWFFHKCEGNGWMNGKNKIKNWQSTIRAWRAAGYLPNQKNPEKRNVADRGVGGNF